MNLFQGLLFLDGFRVAPEPVANRPVVARMPAGKRRGAATTATAKRAMPARASTRLDTMLVDEPGADTPIFLPRRSATVL